MNEKIKETGYILLELCRSVLCGEKLERHIIERVDMEQLFQLCQEHSLTAIVCTALEKNGISPSENWKIARAKSIRKNMLLDAEREQIMAYFEKNGIWHMPLKGILLQNDYPQTGMRQMADNDILYDKEYQKQVQDYMERRGYHADLIGKNHHDVYMKPPIYNFEMHTSLISEISPLYAYCAELEQRRVLQEGTRYTYRFTEEDFYIFMTIHAWKHYMSAGTGIRTLLDYHVYLQKRSSSMDWTYIEQELQRIDILAFEQQLRNTVQHIFLKSDVLSVEDKELIENMLFSGTYGTYENMIRKNAEKAGVQRKGGYFVKRIFPDKEFYYQYFPKSKKYPILIPCFWMYRCVRAVTVRRKRYQGEYQMVRKIFEKESLS